MRKRTRIKNGLKRLLGKLKGRLRPTAPSWVEAPPRPANGHHAPASFRSAEPVRAKRPEPEPAQAPPAPETAEPPSPEHPVMEPEAPEAQDAEAEAPLTEAEPVPEPEPSESLEADSGEDAEPDSLEEAAPREDAGAEVTELSEEQREWVREMVIEQLQTVYDPEIPVNIYELGLVYGVAVAPSGRVDVTMTLTSPNCPAAQSLPAEVEQKAAAVHNANGSTVDIVWDPPWDPSMMSEAAQLELNML